jgi:hypothetical protein
MVFPLCLFGFAIFSAGALACMYMMAQTGYWKAGPALEKYKQIAADGHRSTWPIYVLLVGIPLGILIVFGAILLG